MQRMSIITNFKNALVVGWLVSGPASRVGGGQEYGLVPVFKKCRSRGSVRVRTHPRESNSIMTPPRGSGQKYRLVTIFKLCARPCGSAVRF